METTFVLHVEDTPGVLNRIASLVRRRGYNIGSVTVGHTDVSGISRMTLVVDADEAARPRLKAHLYKLVHVRRIEDVTDVAAVTRYLAMIKVAADPSTRAEIMQLVDVFRARVVDVAPESLVIEITGTEDKVEGLMDMLRPYGILETATTGRVTMARGSTGRQLVEARQERRQSFVPRADEGGVAFSV